ncbi:MAG: RTX toxin, partial [Myxococcota bacterium]
LAYGDEEDIGDTELPSSVEDLLTNATPTRVAAGQDHNCVLLSSGGLRCWGHNAFGQLGHGTIDNYGDSGSETLNVLTDVELDLGEAAIIDMALGVAHTCILLDSGAVRCWGGGTYGQLGYGDYGETGDIGDDELPRNEDVPIGGPAMQITAGAYHTCAVLQSGSMRCWGRNDNGQLGYGHTMQIGDDEPASQPGDIDLGTEESIRDISAGFAHTCALFTNGEVRCWGWGRYGQHGQGKLDEQDETDVENNLGDEPGETPGAFDPVCISAESPVAELASGFSHNCAVLENGALRCWGFNGNGQLGYGDTSDIGDDELPCDDGQDVPLTQ